METRLRDSYEFPADLPAEPDPRGALRWTASVIGVTAALLALTNAGAISGWAGSFDPQPAMIPLVRAADGWDETTARLGLAAPHTRMHRAWKHMEQARWSASGPVVEQAAFDTHPPGRDPSIHE